MTATHGLLPVEVAQARLLAATLMRTDTFRKRVHELCMNPLETNRQLIIFKKLPRVHVEDVERYNDVVHHLIDLADHEMLENSPLVTLAMHFMDKESNFQLSKQDLQCMRAHYHGHEGDKLRLLWASQT